MYEEVLPHWRQTGATYFVTFRLADSLPQHKLKELRELKARLIAARDQRREPPHAHAIHRNASPQERLGSIDEISRELTRRVEDWLDQGMGSCRLRVPVASDALIRVMKDGNGATYELGCAVVMPNHVHAVVRPFDPKSQLEDVLKGWKGSSARAINDSIGRSGTLWQRDSFDRIVRDEEHLWRVIQYIGRNPISAKLSANTYRLWISPAWKLAGWRFES